MDNFVILGLTGYFTELAKRAGLPKKYVPLVVLGLAALLTVGNAVLFGGGDWKASLQQGLMLGAVTSGIYGLGKAAKTNPDDPEPAPVLDSEPLPPVVDTVLPKADPISVQTLPNPPPVDSGGQSVEN